MCPLEKALKKLIYLESVYYIGVIGIVDWMKNNNADKVVLKIFDKKYGAAKRAHNCDLCQVYKREAAKGDVDAMKFYKEHINQIVKKYKGITIVLNAKQKLEMLPKGSKYSSKIE